MPGVNFDAAYAGTPHWDIGRPQPAFLRLADSGALRGTVLDVGCGTGEHALMAAAMGLQATGIDASRIAIDLAQRKAEDRSLDARFLVWDALDLPAFSDLVPGDLGPRRVRQDEIRESFADGWEILSIEPATLDVTFTPTGIPAWLAVIARA